MGYLLNFIIKATIDKFIKYIRGLNLRRYIFQLQKIPNIIIILIKINLTNYIILTE